MRVIENSRALAQVCRQASGPLGLVPTMGALHQGHTVLIKRARQENETLAVSIFVNPTQFGAEEDLAQYPRDLGRDLDLLRGEGTDLVFLPPVEEMYPPGFDTWVSVDGLSNRLEGVHRPGHFRGVATVVTKLFNLLRPDRAYFGQKDGQQVAVIRRLVRDLDLDLEIVVVPTVRDADGLAHSSRNKYLSPEQRRAAPIIFKALRRAEELWSSGHRGRGQTAPRGASSTAKRTLGGWHRLRQRSRPGVDGGVAASIQRGTGIGGITTRKGPAHRQHHPRVNHRTGASSYSGGRRPAGVKKCWSDDEPGEQITHCLILVPKVPRQALHHDKLALWIV